MTHPYFDHPGPIAIAHRGGAGVEPENTMRAFERAVAEGYRWLETDVHATSDGEVVAFHDSSLDRMTDRRGLIRDRPWADVREARVAGTEPIPRLVDLLEAFPDARFSIDPKHNSAVGPLVDVVRRTGVLDRVCFGAFSDRRLGRLRRELGDAACIGLGPYGTTAVVLRSRRLPAPLPRHRPDCVQPPFAVRGRPLATARFVEAAHGLGLSVVTWTVDEVDDLHAVLDAGVDAVITDHPSRLRAVLEARGAWHA
ncbi:MAG: glycerophosphodiester phosphodiesterase family protein [Actinomycetota bacterium]